MTIPQNNIVDTEKLISECEKLNTFCLLDNFLDGGFEKGVVTTMYGPASSGKTNLCIITTINNAKDNKKVVYIDTESSFSVKRAEQIADAKNNNELKKILSNITLVRPKTFLDQSKIINVLDNYLKNNKTDLVIIDSICMLYRLEKSDNDISDANKDLNKQINTLNNLAEKYNIPIIITNQVYSMFNQTDNIRIVGGDIIKYSSKCLIQLEKDDKSRKMKLKKHRHLPEKEECFIIVNDGIKFIEKIDDGDKIEL